VSLKQPSNKSEKLAKRTVQLIGFTFALGLTVYKLSDPLADIPWWVIFGFVGVGVSAEIDINSLIGRK